MATQPRRDPPAHAGPAHNRPAQEGPGPRRKRASMQRTADVLAVVAIGSLAGVLIWTKLKLVSPVPRTAFADPPAEQTGEQADDQAAERADERATSQPTGLPAPVRPRGFALPPIPPGP